MEVACVEVEVENDANKVATSPFSSRCRITILLSPLQRASYTFGIKVLLFRFIFPSLGFASNKCTVGRGGQPIQGSAADLDLIINNQSVSLMYIDVTKGWQITSTNQ